VNPLAAWFDNTPLPLIGLVMLVTLALAGLLGAWVRRWQERKSPNADEDGDGEMEGYVVSASLALLGLLLGFTFALAVDRFETRRALVLQEANAIGTAYLRSQALTEPHRSRMSKVLFDYADNRIAFATAARADQPRLLAINDRLLIDLWSAALAANDTIQNSPFTVAFLSPVNEVIDLGASSKAARRVRVPSEVFLVLWIYIAVTAGILGYARTQARGRRVAGVLSVLVTMAFMLILDIDRPRDGGITEGQGPMLQLRDTLSKQPPGTFDRWRQPQSGSGVSSGLRSGAS
jgi:hypothetical protein